MKTIKDKNTTVFIKHLKSVAKKYDVKLFFPNENFIFYESTKCKGYFDEGNKELYVASKKKDSNWLRVLVHEFSHMEQWIQDIDVWNDADVMSIDCGIIIELWIENKIELNKAQLNDYINKSINLELDCERRTIQNIKKFKLPLNIKQTIQKANSYLYFYHHVAKTRKWYVIGKEPYNNKKIWSEMPTDFDNNYFDPDKKLLALYKIK